MFDQSIDDGIIERAYHDVHRLSHECVGEGAEFPVAQMRSGYQTPRPAAWRP